jgi:hypothetical protein
MAKSLTLDTALKPCATGSVPRWEAQSNVPRFYFAGFAIFKDYIRRTHLAEFCYDYGFLRPSDIKSAVTEQNFQRRLCIDTKTNRPIFNCSDDTCPSADLDAAQQALQNVDSQRREPR